MPSVGLMLLQRLLTWPHLVLPMASATCVIICELLQAASATPRLPAQTRGHVYQATNAVLCAFGLPAADALAQALLKAAWAEFCHSAAGDALTAEGLSGGPAGAEAAPAQPAAARQGSKKRRRAAQGGNGGKGTSVGADAGGAAATVEHSHRPANAQHVMACQVRRAVVPGLVPLGRPAVSRVASSVTTRHAERADASRSLGEPNRTSQTPR